MLYFKPATLVLALAVVSGVFANPLLPDEDHHQQLSKRWKPDVDKIRGVNLGSQFIIEPWMAYDEWLSMGCNGTNDEWSCVVKLGQDAADQVWDRHWQTWITQQDITQIRQWGLNTIRIPVGFWIKEDLVLADEHFPRGGLKYLDQMVEWAADEGLYVVMDLHAAPGGQTAGQQFTGHSVEKPGWYTPENFERTYCWLEWMTERIHTNHAYRNVGMLHVMNEPVRAGDDPEDAKLLINTYYPTAYNRIRAAEKKLGITEECDMLNVQFMAKEWSSGNPWEYLPTNSSSLVTWDDHRYLKWDPKVGDNKTDYIEAACKDDRGQNVIVGEWSISIADKLENNAEFGIVNATQAQKDWYRNYFAVQVRAYEKSLGWIFWTFRCNWIGGKEEWRWCYEYAVQQGVIPTDASLAAGEADCDCYE